MYCIDREKLLQFLHDKSKIFSKKAKNYAKKLKFNQASECISKVGIYNELFSIVCEEKCGLDSIYIKEDQNNEKS